MFNMFSRPQAAIATVPAVAATAGETSSDTILIERLAAGDKLAMQISSVDLQIDVLQCRDGAAVIKPTHAAQ
jgi:hypothetical protein